MGVVWNVESGTSYVSNPTTAENRVNPATVGSCGSCDGVGSCGSCGGLDPAEEVDPLVEEDLLVDPLAVEAQGQQVRQVEQADLQDQRNFHHGCSELLVVGWVEVSLKIHFHSLHCPHVCVQLPQIAAQYGKK